MTTRRGAKGRRGVLWIVGLCLLIPLAWPLAGLACLNLAQVRRLGGVDDPALFALASSLLPGNAQARWQASEAYLRAGDLQRAADLVGDVGNPAMLDAVQANRLIVLLLLGGREGEALDLYRQVGGRLDVSDLAAAGLLASGLTGRLLLSGVEERLLLGQLLALNPDTPEFEQFARQLDAPDFAASAIGQQLVAALTARAPSEHPARVDTSSQEQVRARVAEALEVDPALVLLGGDLIPNGSFEASPTVSDLVAPSLGSLRGWLPAYGVNSNPDHFSAFLVGVDRALACYGSQSIRVDGLAAQRASHADLWHESVGLERGRPYVFTFLYRTTADRQAAVRLSDDPAVLLAGNYELPATSGAWHRFTAVGWNRGAENALVRPLLRFWGEGTVWFDAVSLFPLELKTPMAPRDTVISVGAP